MNEKKKRGIVVPVMALAVCAVAMVGLGYAAFITSSVTSDGNGTAVLMLDMAKLDEYQAIKESKSPGNSTTIDGILSITISNDRNASENKVKFEGGCALIKVYGTLDKRAFTLSASISNSGSSTSNDSPSVVLSLFAVTDGGKIDFDSPIGIRNGTSGVFETDDASPSTSIAECGKMYLVAVSSIGGNSIDYEMKNPEGTIAGGVKGTFTTGTPSSTSSYNLKYVFTAQSVDLTAQSVDPSS